MKKFLSILLVLSLVLALAACGGKSAADAPLNVGSNVDAITGATVSTKGITAGVNAALSVAGVLG